MGRKYVIEIDEEPCHKSSDEKARYCCDLGPCNIYLSEDYLPFMTTLDDYISEHIEQLSKKAYDNGWNDANNNISAWYNENIDSIIINIPNYGDVTVKDLIDVFISKVYA